MVDIIIRKFVKGFGTFLKKDNGIDGFNITVRETFLCFVFYAGILP